LANEEELEVALLAKMESDVISISVKIPPSMTAFFRRHACFLISRFSHPIHNLQHIGRRNYRETEGRLLGSSLEESQSPDGSNTLLFKSVSCEQFVFVSKLVRFEMFESSVAHPFHRTMACNRVEDSGKFGWQLFIC
jgi:hypothetical protein